MNPKALEPKEINIMIGNGIRLHRKKRNLTIENLAELINLSSSYLGLIERGQRGLSVSTLFQTLQVFSVTLEELIAEKDIQFEDLNLLAEESDEVYSSSRATLLSLLYNMTDEEMVFVIDVIKSLKQYNKVVCPKDVIESQNT